MTATDDGQRGGFGSLQLRFMLTVLLGATLFAALAGALAYRLGQHRAQADSARTLEDLALTVEKTVAIGTFAADPVLLREIVDGLARNDLVAEAEVLTARGTTLAVARRAGAAPAEDPALSMARPLVSPFDAHERIGSLRLRADARQVSAAARSQALTLAGLMAGQTALVAWLLYGAAARLVSRPIVQLAQDLQAMPPGTIERLAIPPRHRRDEIGRLIDGANALLEANAVALRRERALRAEIESMEAQYRQIFDASSAGIFVLDTEGRLINGNPTVSKVVGLSLPELRELRHDSFIQRVFGQPEQVRQMLESASRLGETVSADLELVQHGERRRWVHCLISVQRSGGAEGAQASTVEGVIYDITERKRAETAVRHRAEHDPLTGLANRAGCTAAVMRFVAECRATGSALSLLCIDLDGFKHVNDALGHAAGDQVLVACAQRMLAAVRRSSDLVGRLGGDEFLVVLREVGPSDTALAHTATAMLAALCEPVTLPDGSSAQVGASIGMACLPRHGSDYEGLLEAADQAMYEVKRSGKNSFAMALAPATPPAGSAPRGKPAAAVGGRAVDQSGIVAACAT